MLSSRSSRTLLIALAVGFTLALSFGSVVEAAHAVRHHGTGHIKGTFGVDFDSGLFNNGFNGEDMYFHIAASNERYFEPDQPKLILKMGTTRPSYSTCATAALIATHYLVRTKNVGQWFCLKTGGGRFVRFRLDGFDPYPGGVDITYTTWEL